MNTLLESKLVISIFFFTFLILIRSYYVSNFAASLPFWDQWDAELDGLLKPWIEGHFQISSLWQPHNEHRILPTRLLTLAFYELNGKWNNCVIAYFNVLLASLTPALLCWLLYKSDNLQGFRIWIFLVTIAQYTLPFSYENMLVSFQNQFYFLIFFTVCAFGLVALRGENTLSRMIIFLLCSVSILTIASGLITPMVVAIMYALKCYLRKCYGPEGLVLIGIFAALAYSGFVLIPHIPKNESLRANDFLEWCSAFIRTLSWPIGPHNWAAIPLWLSPFVGIPFLIREHKFNDRDLLMTGCFMWSFLQVGAISYGRGHELTSLPSRYTDLLSIGLISSAWFAIRFTKEFKGKVVLKYIVLSIFPIFFFSHAKRIKADFRKMKQVHFFSLIQTKNMIRYLDTHNTNFLRQPYMHTPYPDSVRLRMLLDNQTIVNLIPIEDCKQEIAL